jgi:hypothetical protein
MPEGKGHKGFWLQYYPQGKGHLMSNVPFGSRYIKGMGTMYGFPSYGYHGRIVEGRVC